MIQKATFKYLMQQIESRHSIKYMYIHVYSQNIGQHLMCSRMDEWIKNMQWNIIQPQKEGDSDTCYNMDEPQDNMLSKISPSQKDKYTVWFHLDRVSENETVSRSIMSDSVTPIGCSPLGSLSMGFSRQEYWSGLPFPSPGCLTDPGIEPRSPNITGRFFTI